MSAALQAIQRANDEAIKLIKARAQRRRFRRPVTWRTFDSSGNLIMKHDSSGWTCGQDSPERGEPGAIVLEDARGRRASVRVEISTCPRRAGIA